MPEQPALHREEQPDQQRILQRKGETLMETIRMLDTYEEIIGLSGHLLAVSKKK